MHLKSASKDIYNVTKDFNKYYPFAFSINQRILKNKIQVHLSNLECRGKVHLFQ